MATNFERVTQDEWDKFEPAKATAKANTEWDALIDAVIDGGGEAIAITVEGKDEEARKRSLRGKRIGIARRASKRNEIKLEFRNSPDFKRLLIRLSDKPLPSLGDESQPKRGPGRPRKS